VRGSSSLAAIAAGLCLMLPALAPAQVDTAWVRFYTWEPTQWSGAADLAVDAAGNVYVTGTSSSSVTLEDFATLKYSPDGDTLWVRRYDGPSHGEDEAYDLEIDDSGNVYVAGGSADSTGSWDCLTIKYGPNGETCWVARYDGPGHDDDWVNDVEVDRTGNVYVTGTSITTGDNSDIVTMKYNSAGVVQWVSRHGGAAGLEDEANSIAVDDQGNAYVTGVENRGARPDTASNMVTIKYGSSGDTSWVSRLAGTANGLDQGYDIAVDGAHNVYVTGTVQESLSQCITIKYGSGGETLWVRRCCGDYPHLEQSGAALTLDDAGYVYVGGRIAFDASGLDFLVIKYGPSGDTMWVRTFNGPHASSADWVNDIAVDDEGGVYVTGMSEQDHPSGEDDYATVKFSAAGDQEWVATYNHPANDHDEAFAVAVDNLHYVYVTGLAGNSYATIKYTQAGALTETRSAEVRPTIVGPTIVRRVLFLQNGDCTGERQTRASVGLSPLCALLDISGRNALNLHPGPNDVSRLSPGVYFVREQSVASSQHSGRSAVTKVVITR